MEVSISNHIQHFLKGQTSKINDERSQWDKKKQDKERINENEKKALQDRVKFKTDKIGEYKDQ